MSIIVFIGPTLDKASALRELDATYLPPASQGDVFLATRANPWAIGIVDGYFKQVPAVWHKEILWALSCGIHVFGAASMGALRAAELASFGMRGVGKIFRDYESGVLEDDDEVCIVHSDANSGYRTLSDAMVNIRATLASAVAEKIIGADLSRALLDQAKSTFYQNRSYAKLLENARGDAAHLDQLNRLKRWLPEGAIDQKREDAIAMLITMREMQRTHPQPGQVEFHFQHTDAWEQVRRQIHLKSLNDSPGVASLQGDAALSELRLRGTEFLTAREHAFLHTVCQELAQTNGDGIDNSLIPHALNEFRLEHGLEAPGSVEPWLEEQGLDLAALARLLLEQLTTKRLRALLDAEMERVLIQQLRISGRFRALQDRAEHKQLTLSRRGLQNPDLHTAGLSEEMLWYWFFTDHLAMAAASDPDEYALRLGWSKDALRREVLREWLYQKHTATGS